VSTPTQPGDAHANHPNGDGLQFIEAYSFIKSSPNWMTNILLGLVCQFIPFVGPIVFIGYEFELIESLHRDRRRQYPDFDFGRFSVYLMRGVWPFLVGLCAGLVITPVFWLLMFLPVGLAAAAGNEETAGVLAGLASLVSMAFMLVGMLAMMLVLTPMMLRAGLAQDFAAGFNFEFIYDFIRRMWKEELMSWLFLWFSAMIVLFVGMLACCVGVWPASVIVSMAQFHLMYQLYEIYLRRGGIPIPLKDPA